MTKVLVTDTNLTNIANAIREKNGETTSYKVDEMANAIDNISTSGGTAEDLSSELSAQNTLITTQETTIDNIISALEGKASGGGGELQYVTGTKNLNYTESDSGDVVIEVNDLTFTPKYILVTRQSSSANVGLWASTNEYIFIAASGGLFNQDVIVTKISDTTVVQYGTNKVTVNITNTGFNVVSNNTVVFSAANYDYIAIG